MKFHQNFATPSDLGQELNISSKVVTRVLQRLGISPVAGPSITGTTSQIFARSVLPADLKHRVNPYNDDFSIYWLRNDISTIAQTAKELGLSLPDTSRLIKLFIKPTRAPCYRHYHGISPKDKAKLQPLLRTLVPLTDILSAHSMSHHNFSRRFMNPRFVRKVKVGKVEYLTQDDAEKITSLLAEYCTTMEADKILGTPKGGEIKLIKRHKIRQHFLPHTTTNTPCTKLTKF
ncbi:hypothetical protein HU763_018500 [Pseudomonas anuradhapurensis]|uniref:hypothetical protein n=1 Tax=Pseudomonas anuradhapurensis TaxID=485870 RepID=UPI001646AB20|nr:hypothetical protein [Pseudomonas anuradhapurensis]QXI46741.1 hypothetical protein HU763_018500 [Pseudomonas anuradhapurensis]